MDWGHDDLMRDLRDSLLAPDIMVWANMQLGTSGSMRPDVFTMRKSYVRPRPLAYECKISRSDFLSDVTSGKWQSYLQVATGVYFAAPDKLIELSELPPRCGLIVRKQNVWRTIKRATLSPVTLPEDVYLKLLIDGIHREGRERYFRDFNTYRNEEKIRKLYGDKVATILRAFDQAEYDIARKRELAEKVLADAEKEVQECRERETRQVREILTEICSELGVDVNGDDLRYSVRRKVQQALLRLSESAEIKHLQDCLSTVRRALDESSPKMATVTG